MRDRDDGGEWLSAHLCFRGSIYGDTADAVAREVVGPVLRAARAEGRTRGHFFVRYHDATPHVRLRLRVASGQAVPTASWLVGRLRAIAPSAHVEPYHGDAVESRAPSDTSQGEGSRHPEAGLEAVRWIAYEPEYSRYGGRAAVGVAEYMFEASTDAALHLLAGLRPGWRAGRLGRGMLAMLATLHACFDGRRAAAAAARRYGAGYLGAPAGRPTSGSDASEVAFAQAFHRQAAALHASVESGWTQLESGTPLPGLEAFSEALGAARTRLTSLCAAGEVEVSGVTTRTWATCAPRIVPSYMHMMNNRMGVSVPEESYLAHVISWALAGEDPGPDAPSGAVSDRRVNAPAIDRAPTA